MSISALKKASVWSERFEARSSAELHEMSPPRDYTRGGVSLSVSGDGLQKPSATVSRGVGQLRHAVPDVFTAPGAQNSLVFEQQNGDRVEVIFLDQAEFLLNHLAVTVDEKGEGQAGLGVGHCLHQRFDFFLGD